MAKEPDEGKADGEGEAEEEPTKDEGARQS